MDWLVWMIALALFGIPLLVQYKPTMPEHIMDHPRRRKILRLLEDRPMSSKKALQERSDCALGTLDHHLRVLRQGGLVSSLRVGNYRRYFVAGSGLNVQAIGVLRGHQAATLAQKVMESPGVVQHEMTTDLQMNRKMVRTYLDRLVASGLVEERVVGRQHEYYPGKPLAKAIEAVSDGVDALRPRRR